MALALIVVCLFLMLVILVQKGRGGGLVGAFGGAGGMSAFGAKTGDVFTWITIVFASVFVVLSVLGNYVYDQSDRPVVAKTPTTEVVPAVPVDGPPPELPPGAIPIEMPQTKPGEPTTIKLDVGDGTGPIKAVPVDPEKKDEKPADAPAAEKPAEGSDTPAAGETAPPAEGEQPPAEKPEEEPK